MISSFFGKPFGRNPINIISTFCLFTLLKLYLWYQNLRNQIRNRVHPTLPFKSNDPLYSEGKFREYLSQGYNKVNVGGGSKNLKGFVNIDFLPAQKVERMIIANILDLSFIADNTLSQVHTNHVLEHLTAKEIELQLLQYKRILKPGGILTIRCPNALGVSFGFWFGIVQETEKEEFVNCGFPSDEDFAPITDGWYYRNLFGLFHWFYGDKGSLGNDHKSFLTPTMLSKKVITSGFSILKTSNPESTNLIIIARRP